MSESIRALVVVLLISTIYFSVVYRPVVTIMTRADFTRRRNLWFGLTLAVFLAPNYWMYASVAIMLLLYARRHESNIPALYFFVLFTMPVVSVVIPAGGVITFLFLLTHPRMLALVILLPAFLSLIRQSSTLPFGRTGSDKALAAFLLLTSLLYLREDTVTNSLRQVFYLFVDAFLPYYVISRTLKTLQGFKDALLSLVLATMTLALIAVFESTKHWLLYSPLANSLALQGGMTEYLGRDSMLRACASAGQPIALGYLMVVAIGFYLFLQRSFLKTRIVQLGMMVLVAGLIAPLSRGPWIGAAVLSAVFVATGKKPLLRLLRLVLVGTFAFTLIAFLPGGERVVNLLPFVGTTEKGNIDYRENLLTNSLIVIQRNPWFGSTDYMNSPEMESMRQGQGIIDIVNTYIGIALETGFVGLSLFAAFFLLSLLAIHRAMRSIPDKDSDDFLLGRATMTTLLAILIMIFTVSSITFIPVMYWSVAGLGVAYAQMVRQQRETTLPRIHD